MSDNFEIIQTGGMRGWGPESILVRYLPIPAARFVITLDQDDPGFDTGLPVGTVAYPIDPTSPDEAPVPDLMFLLQNQFRPQTIIEGPDFDFDACLAKLAGECDGILPDVLAEVEG